MTMRLLLFASLCSAATCFGAETSRKFAPEFFVFENGARFGSTENQIKVLKELGFDSLGSAKPHDLPARIKLHEASGLRISSLYIGGRIGGGNDVKAINPAIPESIRHLKGHDTIIELTVQGGRNNTDEEAVAFVQEVADMAKESGLRVVLYPHAGFYVDTLGDAVRIARLSGRANVGAMFNLCHFLKVEPKADLRETLENAGDLLWRVSICGADTNGTTWGELIQTLDRGSFDQKAFLKLMREIGFTGDVGLQCYAIRGDARDNLGRSIAAWRKHLAASLIDPSTTPAALPNPIAHWKLDDADAVARDSAGTHHGRIVGSKSASGKVGRSLEFVRQRGDHVEIPYSKDFAISTFTVSAWVYLTKEPTFSGILGTRHNGEHTFDLKVNDAKVHGDIGDGLNWIETKVNFYAEDTGSNGQGGDLPIERWFHIAYVIDAGKGECRLYLDADLKKRIPFTGKPILMTPQQKMHIGHSSGTEFMDGRIDELKIWNVPLTTEQVSKAAGIR